MKQRMTIGVLLVAMVLMVAPVLTANTGNWDRTLDMYEEVLGSLMSAHEKLENNPQDMNAISELNNANMRALELSQELQVAQGQMTQEQMMRFMTMYQNYALWASTRM